MLKIFGRPIIRGFRGTTIHRAFFLNAIVSALIAVMAYESKKYYTQVFKDRSDRELIIMSFITTFFTAITAYYVMRLLFGYGGGMLAPIIKN